MATKRDERPTEPDTLVPDPQVCREFGITPTTLWRWDRDPQIDFPPRVMVRARGPNSRGYRSRRALDEYKEKLLREAAKQTQLLKRARRAEQREGAR
jgi:hypothetical protein